MIDSISRCRAYQRSALCSEGAGESLAMVRTRRRRDCGRPLLHSSLPAFLLPISRTAIIGCTCCCLLYALVGASEGMAAGSSARPQPVRESRRTARSLAPVSASWIRVLSWGFTSPAACAWGSASASHLHSGEVYEMGRTTVCMRGTVPPTVHATETPNRCTSLIVHQKLRETPRFGH